MKKRWAQIMAILALLWIIISIVWTSLIFIFSNNNVERELTPEEIKEIQWLIDSESENIESSSWEVNWSWINIEINN